MYSKRKMTPIEVHDSYCPICGNELGYGTLIDDDFDEGTYILRYPVGCSHCGLEGISKVTYRFEKEELVEYNYIKKEVSES